MKFNSSKTTIMETKEIASRLIELCNQGKWDQAQEELYAENCISIESPTGKEDNIVKGMKAIHAKGEEWAASVETMHGGNITDLVVTPNNFSFRQTIDATFKGMGRVTMEEISVYTVQDGKIVREQFFY